MYASVHFSDTWTPCIPQPEECGHAAPWPSVLGWWCKTHTAFRFSCNWGGMQGLAVLFHLLPAVKWKTQRIAKLIMFFIVFQREPPNESLSSFWIIFAQTLFFSSLPTAQRGIIKHFTLRNSFRVRASCRAWLSMHKTLALLLSSDLCLWSREARKTRLSAGKNSLPGYHVACARKTNKKVHNQQSLLIQVSKT